MKIKLLTSTAKMPVRESEYAAGYDLCADLANDTDHLVIPPHEVRKVSTGIAIELPKNTFGGIFARSGLATKQGLRPANAVGVIDEDYRGPVIVALYNDSNDYRVIEHGQRIAQLVVIPYMNVQLEQVDDLSTTIRGDGGFGSTGK